MQLGARHHEVPRIAKKIKPKKAQLRELEKEVETRTAALRALEERGDAAAGGAVVTQRECDEAKAALQDVTQRLSTLYEEVETEIKEAEPALATASIALDGLNKKDMMEVKSLTKAPAAVEKAFAAVLTLLGEKDVSWAGTKKVTSHPNFMTRLADFDKDSISAATAEKLAAYVNDEAFNPYVMMKASMAAAAMCNWVLGIWKYHQIAKSIEPKRAQIQELEKEVETRTASLRALEEKLSGGAAGGGAVVAAEAETAAARARLDAAQAAIDQALAPPPSLLAMLSGRQKDRRDPTLQALYDAADGAVPSDEALRGLLDLWGSWGRFDPEFPGKVHALPGIGRAVAGEKEMHPFVGDERQKVVQETAAEDGWAEALLAHSRHAFSRQILATGRLAALKAMPPDHQTADAIFTSIDTDGDGKITDDELLVACLERGVGDTDVSELFKALGLKEDGMISLDAWRAGFGNFVALTETETETESGPPSLLAEVSKTSSYLRTKCEAAKLCLEHWPRGDGAGELLLEPVGHDAAPPTAVEERGVSVEWWLAVANRAPFVMTRCFVEAFNKPVTRAKSCALWFFVPPQFRVKPACFISHAWDGSLWDIRAPADAPSLWLDTLAINQHPVAAPDGEGGAAAAFVDVARIGAAVETIGRTVIICPGDHPVMPFGRSWCLYEIASTPDAALEVRIGWGSWGLADHERMRASVGALDVTKAETFSADDKAMIDKLVEEKLGPPAAASALVRSKIVTGFRKATADALVGGDFEATGIRQLDDERIVGVWAAE